MYKDGKADTEMQLDEDCPALQLTPLNQSVVEQHIRRQQWALIASALFNLMLIMAFVSILAGSYFAARRSCINSKMVLPVAGARTHAFEGESNFGLVSQ